MIWFILVSFVASGIIYGIRGNSNIAYIDCLFIAASGMTVTGLVTFPVSQLTLAQQIVVFILMSIGNLIIDSVVIVLLRRYFFGKKFRKVVKRSASVRARMREDDAAAQAAGRAATDDPIAAEFHKWNGLGANVSATAPGWTATYAPNSNAPSTPPPATPG